MKIHLWTWLILSLLTGQSLQATASAMRSYHILHDAPATAWTGANPLGNGRMGAMVRGGIKEETIHLNVDTLWSGEPQPHYDGAKCLEHLDRVRALIFAGQHLEATDLGQKTMLGVYNQCYQPLGHLKITMPTLDPQDVMDYSRTLDLNRALSITTFHHADTTYQRSAFISHPAQIMVVQLTSSQPTAIDVNLGLGSLLEHVIQADPTTCELIMSGRAPIHADPHYQGKRVEYDQTPAQKGMRFRVQLHAEHRDGTCVEEHGRLQVRGASEVILRLSAATSYNGFDRSPSANGLDEKKLAELPLQRAGKQSYRTLRQQHVADHAALFERVDIQLGDTEKQALPVTQRIGTHHQPGQDPDLDELFYQFGRYLLIASSRAGSQPAHLQGIWSYKLNPSWSANWTMNCNAQFNYIGMGAARLTELGKPFQRMMHEAAVDGAQVARSWYGASGWVVHHNLDLWRAAMPVAGNVLWATFPTGGTWSMVELFDHWKFCYDRDELARLWPLLRGNAEFWLDHLVQDPDSDRWVSCPDVYFENTARKPDGGKVVLCSAPVSSTIMIKQSFLDVLEAAAILELQQDPVVEQIRLTLKQFPGLEINQHGEIRQWDRDREDTWKEHDATQLLVMNGAIYTDQISPRKTPQLAEALGLMLERRQLGMNGQGSWRAAFPANTYARLGQGNKCHQVLTAFYRKWANPNLTARFIQSDWEIDGNLGMMGAIQECLVQSHTGEIELLPALPDAWKQEGSVRGLGVRGGGVVSFAWKDGRVTRWNVKGPNHLHLRIRVNGELQAAQPLE